ncbi:MAG TPA: hypothetical protein HA272_07680 [Methanoregula sp.]|nr:hypothetical protein [Methanoregula sp.]
MPVLVKPRKKSCSKDDFDEQDLRDIAEAQEDIKKGRVSTTKELRAKLGI